jgi:cell division protein FtsB
VIPRDFLTPAFTSPECRVHKQDVKLRRLIITFYLVLFVSVAAGSAGFFWQTRAEFVRLKEIEADSRSKLTLAEERLRDQQRMLDRLRTDPAYVEMVIRRRLGYAKPDEFIFRFEQ